MNYDNLFNQPRQGWQCPVCKKVHNPSIPSCDCHKRQVVSTSTDSTQDESVLDPVALEALKPKLKSAKEVLGIEVVNRF